MKKRSRFNTFTSVVFVFLIVFMLGSIVSDLATTSALQSQIDENEALAEEVRDKNERLTSTKDKLSNPDYIEYLARGKYLITKYGEQVFKFPSIEEEASSSGDNS